MLPDQTRNLKELVGLFEKGTSLKYLFFWGHRPKRKDEADKSCLSNWFPAPFETDGIRYPTTEHYMMAQKALLFDDKSVFEKIIEAKSPGEAKSLGRQVSGFSEDRWTQERFRIVVEGNLRKFEQNEQLKLFLMTTGKKVLVEASPMDRIWGIGLASDDPKIQNPKQWNGLNLLGFTLMEVRYLLNEEK